jgi:hypothetical protein
MLGRLPGCAVAPWPKILIGASLVGDDRDRGTADTLNATSCGRAVAIANGTYGAAFYSIAYKISVAVFAGVARVDNLVVVANLSVTAETVLRYSARVWTNNSTVMCSCRCCEGNQNQNACANHSGEPIPGVHRNLPLKRHIWISGRNLSLSTINRVLSPT